jgi:hypothetical protein
VRPSLRRWSIQAATCLVSLSVSSALHLKNC